MNVHVAIFVDGQQHVSYQWPFVPSIGSRVVIGLKGNPNNFDARVDAVKFYQRPDGNQGADLLCTRLPSIEGRAKKGKR